MWSVDLKIEDNGNDREIKYYFDILPFTYNDLFLKLDSLLGRLITKEQIDFSFLSGNGYTKIYDWSNFIFVDETIQIVIHKRETLYYMIEEGTNMIHEKSKNIADLYKYYREHNFAKPVLIYGDQLIDVLENPQIRLNMCKNRLIENYSW